jgi:hypothetical protein
VFELDSGNAGLASRLEEIHWCGRRCHLWSI